MTIYFNNTTELQIDSEYFDGANTSSIIEIYKDCASTPLYTVTQEQTEPFILDLSDVDQLTSEDVFPNGVYTAKVTHTHDGNKIYEEACTVNYLILDDEDEYTNGHYCLAAELNSAAALDPTKENIEKAMASAAIVILYDQGDCPICDCSNLCTIYDLATSENTCTTNDCTTTCRSCAL